MSVSGQRFGHVTSSLNYGYCVDRVVDSLIRVPSLTEKAITMLSAYLSLIVTRQENKPIRRNFKRPDRTRRKSYRTEWHTD
ncbi:hypothetical protein J6590_013174 [Homalodisca vitripennis]|nr:hypothetical protein J6590_013174 [Homalodisca vitripennis]